MPADLLRGDDASGAQELQRPFVQTRVGGVGYRGGERMIAEDRSRARIPANHHRKAQNNEG